jgi:hypothetical protein
MGNLVIRYLVILAALLVGGSVPAFAQLTLPTITVDKAGDGTGTVTIRRSIDFGGRYLELTAIPAAGSVFAGWSANCLSYGSLCLLRVTSGQPVTVSATFLIAVRLTVVKAGNGTGTVTSDVGPINCGAKCGATYGNGTVVTLVAAAGAGQSFNGWSGGSCSGTGTCIVTVTTATTVTATFTDANPPNTTINHGPSTLSGDDRPTFTFSSTEPDSTFRCQLDGAPFASCTSPHTVSVGNGPHTFAVFAVDAGGNADPTPATYWWTAAAETIVEMNLNQHGLTGFWYEPSTSGQGVGVEVFPDLIGPGTGRVQVSWFTYDTTTTGGADRQRWYTMGDNISTGAASVALPIYQNVGGTFNAPPITNATQVGTATLRFADCDHGTLGYTFTDGSGRSGTIDLTRLTKNVTCVASGARPVNADFAFSGNWYDPATSGQGFTLEINPLSPVAFFAWYTYAPGGAAAGAAGQRWYTGQSGYVAGTRKLAMTLNQTTGGLFDAPTPTPATVAVGTATLTFQSCTAATLDYTFTGGSSAGASGRITLTKIGPAGPGCGW